LEASWDDTDPFLDHYLDFLSSGHAQKLSGPQELPMNHLSLPMWTAEQNVSKGKRNRMLELLDELEEHQGLLFVVASRLPYAML
jgi:hypothetical protein